MSVKPDQPPHHIATGKDCAVQKCIPINHGTANLNRTADVYTKHKITRLLRCVSASSRTPLIASCRTLFIAIHQRWGALVGLSILCYHFIASRLRVPRDNTRIYASLRLHTDHHHFKPCPVRSSSNPILALVLVLRSQPRRNRSVLI